VHKDFAVVAMDLLHIGWEPFELEAVDVCYYSCPSDYMALALAVAVLDKVVVLLGGSKSPHTCCCSCGRVVLEIGVPVDIEPWASHMDSKLWHVLGLCGLELYGPELCELELEQPVPAACLGLQLVAAAEFQVQATG